MALGYILQTMHKQGVFKRLLLLVIVIFVAILLFTAIYNRRLLAQERTLLEQEVLRTRFSLDEVNDDLLATNRLIIRLESSPPRQQRLNAGPLETLKNERTKYQEQAAMLEALVKLDESLISRDISPAERLHLELDRYALILDREGMEAYDDESIIPIDDPIYFVFFQATKEEMREKQAFYQQVEAQAASSSIPLQNVFPQPFGWTGSEALTRFSFTPLSYLLVALASLFPAVWLSALLETRVV